ncbi:MAG: hypothetical protein HY718_00055, partial [Planctomycetes bacterium]|nr:hypothetical protein [Planctomycetota bacterium]
MEPGAQMQARRGAPHRSDRKRNATIVVIVAVCAALIGREEVRAEVTLIGPPISLAGSRTWDPAACYNAQADQFLVLWRDTSEPVVGMRLKGQRIDAGTGSLVGSFFHMTLDANTLEAYNGQAAYNSVNGEWFVVFEGTEDPSVQGQDIFGQRLAGDGTRVGPHIPLVVKSGFQREPHVAHDPVNNRYLVTWFHNTDAISRRIYSRLFDSTGSPLANEVKLSEVDDREKFDPTVVFNPVYNEYLAAWSDYRAWPGSGQDNKYKDIYGQRVDTNGLKMGGNIPIHVPPDPVNHPNGQDSLNGLTCNTRDGNYAIGFTKLPAGGG